jgi:hypothetical protein
MPKEIVLVDLWQLYLAESIQEEAEHWSTQRVLDVLLCPSTTSFKVLCVDKKAQCMEIELVGQCYAGDYATVAIKLYSNELSHAQKKELMQAVRVAYPKKTGQDWTMKKSVSTLLGILV